MGMGTPAGNYWGCYVNSKIYVGGGVYMDNVDPKDINEFIYENWKNKNVLRCGEYYIERPKSSFLLNNFHLGGIPGNASYSCSDLKIYRSSSFIPCINKQGEVGVWDCVHNVFLGNIYPGGYFEIGELNK